MKNSAVIGLVVISLLLWAATAPSAVAAGNTRLDDILGALLGVAPKTVDPNGFGKSTAGSVSGGGGLGGGGGSIIFGPQVKNTDGIVPITKTLPPLNGSGTSFFKLPSVNDKGLFGGN